MDVREKLVEQLRELADLTPPICEYQVPEEIELFGKKVTVYCKPFEQFQELLREAADYIANGVTAQECGHWNIIMDDYDCEMMCCSVCGSEFFDGENDTVDCMHNYCPHCGAKMMPQPPKGE